LFVLGPFCVSRTSPRRTNRPAPTSGASSIDFLIGFVVAVLIGLTGIGGGVALTPMLIIFLGMPAAAAVGTGLTFAAIINALVLPMYAFRGKVDFRVAGWMLCGGVPGVVAGGLLLNRLSANVSHRWLYLLLGIMIVSASILNMMRLVRKQAEDHARDSDRPALLGALMLPVGIETGFSSAGSGSFGSLALLWFTRLGASTIVGTSVCFALGMQLVGSGIQIFAGHYDAAVLLRLLVGGVAGSLIGSTLAMRIPSRPLKWALAAWLTVLGVQLCLRGFS
jgi:uncharacterized membrane protein YfcA